MVEWVPQSFPLGEPLAGSRIGEAKRLRSPRWKIGSLLYLTVIAIVSAVTIGSLFAVGFVLLTPPTPATHPEDVTSPTKAVAAPAHLVARTAAETPPRVTGPAALTTATLPRMAGPSPEKPVPPVALSAMAEGDARFANGDAPGARFFYEQAVGAGDAEAALRMGETFDPAFLTLGRLRLVPSDQEAAKFWYRRAFELGNAEARRRFDYLTAEAHDDRPATDAPSDKFRRHAVRRHYRTAPLPRVTFYEIPEQISHRGSDGP